MRATKNLKYHIITFGCQMNISDSERMTGVFEKMGMSETKNEREANVIVVNACSVRQKAIDRIWGKLHVFHRIKQSRNGNPLFTVLTGCVLPADRPKFVSKFDLYFPMKDLQQLPEKLNILMKKKVQKNNQQSSEKKVKRPSVSELLADKQISYTDKPISPNSQSPGAQEHYLQIRPSYSNKFSAYVPIMTGCNAFCTYCAVPFTRGREVSRKPEEIIDEVEKLIAGGYKEVTLLGQIINKYMMEIDESFFKYLEQTLSKHKIAIKDIPELKEDVLQKKKLFKFHHLLAVIALLGNDFWLRFTSSHPKWFSNELIDTINRYDNIVNHIHLPVQSGADTTLMRMLRPYKVEEYKKIINYTRDNIPGVAITTDVIVGFCEETEEEFSKSKELFEWAKYDMAYISQYSTRPGTKAEDKLNDNVSHEVKVRREKELNDILKKTAFENNQKYEGKELDVLITKVKPNRITGRTRTNKNVLLANPTQDSQQLLGSFKRVKITEPRPWVLKGEFIDK